MFSAAILFCHFNSCMVRLKVHLFKKTVPPHRLFQFLYGTIKGFLRSENLCHLCQFQFLYGTIKGLHWS